MVMKKDPFSFYTIRFSDCDPLGHLNNARYIDYFLNAREDHLKNDYGLKLNEFYKQGLGWFVRSHEINYIRPAQYNEIVHIQSSLPKAGDDFLFVEMQMMDEKQTHTKALLWTIFVSVSTTTGKRLKHSAGFMEFAKAIERVDLLDPAKLNDEFWVLPD